MGAEGEGASREREKGMKSSGRRDGENTKVVVVMGATGSGKSRLAIDLAAFFPVEVINADAMQVYRGLDVLTNKVPVRERRGTLLLCRSFLHHLN